MGEAGQVDVFGGVDTHRDTYVAAVVDTSGRVLGSASFRANTDGYEQLEDWLHSLGRVTRVGVEGTGSYGAGLARYLTAAGIDVVEVNRPNRQLRRQRGGKTDSVDAEAAARAAASGQATAVPKSGVGPVECIRMLLVARRSATKARTQAANQIHALVVTAPEPLKHQLRDLKLKARVRTCAAFRPNGDSCVSYAKRALRHLARRYQTLDAEITQLEAEIRRLCARANPALLATKGVGPDTAAAPPGRSRRQPRTNEIRTLLRGAVWHQPCPGIIRTASSSPAQPGRQPPSLQRALADRIPPGYAPTRSPKTT